jgi:hypothetical protein
MELQRTTSYASRSETTAAKEEEDGGNYQGKRQEENPRANGDEESDEQ